MTGDDSSGLGAGQRSCSEDRLAAHRKAFRFVLAVLLLPFLGASLGIAPRAFTDAWGYLGAFAAASAECLRLDGITAAVSISVITCSVLLLSIYMVARVWLVGTCQFRMCLVCVALLAVLGGYGVHYYRTRVDWTSRGLNPNRPGFKPRVLVLAGTVELWNGDSARRRTTGLFEIRMRGFDHYYCSKWNGYEWTVGSWFRIELAMKDFSQTWGLRCLSHSNRGGRGSWFGADDIIAARRLWSGNEFVGANPDSLVAENRHFGRKEEFSSLTKIGPYLIPRKIKLSQGGNWIETYTIKRIEFDAQPSEAWFQQVKRKHFDRDPRLRKVDLGEPGVAP